MWVNRDEHYSKKLKAIEEFVQVFPDTENATCLASLRVNCEGFKCQKL
jgi:hypothetical protein